MRVAIAAHVVCVVGRRVHPERVRVEVDAILCSDTPARVDAVRSHCVEDRDLPGHAQRAVPLQHLCAVKPCRPRDHIDRRFYLRSAVAPVFPVRSGQHAHMRQAVRDGHASGQLLALALYQCADSHIVVGVRAEVALSGHDIRSPCGHLVRADSAAARANDDTLRHVTPPFRTRKSRFSAAAHTPRGCCRPRSRCALAARSRPFLLSPL